MTPTKPKEKARYTNTKGQRFVSYVDGTSETIDTPEQFNAKVSKAPVPPTTVQPTVSAADLTGAKTTPPPVTPVPQPGIPPRVDTTVNNVLGSIRSQSETAKRLAEEQAAFSTFVEKSNGFDIQNEQLERFGVTPEKLQQLEDIQLQLADRSTASALTKVQIEGAGGQTVGQAQREVTQEDREAAVRDAGLAARAAVLQGNIETGRSLARDAVDIALADRTFQANAKLQEINDLKDVVNEETRQLLQAEERTYQAELARIKELKENISTAMVNGASQAEIAQLNDPNIPDEQKLAMAQSITARGATQMRNLQMGQMQASIANSYSAIADRNERLALAKEAALLDAGKAAQLQMDENAAKSEKALGILQSVKELQTHPGFGSAVGPNFLARGWTPGGLGREAITGNKSDFISEVNMLADTLTLENMDLLKGPATDKDVEIVASSVSKLKNMDVSEKAYDQEFARLQSAAQRIVDTVGMTEEQASFYYGADTNELDQIWNSEDLLSDDMSY